MIQTYALRGRPVPAKNGLWVHVDDCTRLKLERAYAQDSLDAAKAEIARLTAERDAIAAAAFEAAAQALQAVADNWDCGHMESRLCDCARDAEQWGIAAEEVRALTPADTKAALDRMLRDAKSEGMREALAIYQDGLSDDRDAKEIEDAILARAKDMEAGNG